MLALHEKRKIYDRILQSTKKKQLAGKGKAVSPESFVAPLRCGEEAIPAKEISYDQHKLAVLKLHELHICM